MCLKKKRGQELRGGLVVKNTSCSCRRTSLDSSTSRIFTMICNSSSQASSGLCSLEAHIQCPCVQPKHLYTQNKQIQIVNKEHNAQKNCPSKVMKKIKMSPDKQNLRKCVTAVPLPATRNSHCNPQVEIKRHQMVTQSCMKTKYLSICKYMDLSKI